MAPLMSALMLLAFTCAHGLWSRGRLPPVASAPDDLLSKCRLDWYTTNLDHFSWGTGPNGKSSFSLRYYVCLEDNFEKDGPIFFYLGNEADVQLYLNNTGLMWENAADFGAMLIFAEHRYYGKSLPFGEDSRSHMQWLSSEQALADYANLIHSFKEERGLQSSPVIGFGGSYGGMLASWARAKYPHIWQGAIAGSAPIWTFVDESPKMDPFFYSKGVTYDATEAAGAASGCSSAIRAAFKAMTDLGAAHRGPQAVSDAMQVCPNVQLQSMEDIGGLRDWAAAAFDMMAMGNYPYPSGYMLNGDGLLPAWPMRHACQRMMNLVGPLDPKMTSLTSRRLLAASEAMGGSAQEQASLLEGLSAAIGVWYNYTGTLECYNPWAGVNNETKHDGDFWDYQYCTEQFMPMARSGVVDMFWSQPWNDTAAREACMADWGVEPRESWPEVAWGGHQLQALTNVVFSNGLYDPWHGGGVLNNLSSTVTAVIIPEGGHHLDLMFSNSMDPESVKQARAHELAHIRMWIEEYRTQQSRSIA